MASRFVCKLASMVYRPREKSEKSKNRENNNSGLDLDGMEKALNEILKK
ncbi:MAG: hypothetical protein LUC92_06300 [Clostridiales bacterium]|nr:hypothetical protein [Clostridiales bacterium]